MTLFDAMPTPSGESGAAADADSMAELAGSIPKSSMRKPIPEASLTILDKHFNFIAIPPSGVAAQRLVVCPTWPDRICQGMIPAGYLLAGVNNFNYIGKRKCQKIIGMNPPACPRCSSVGQVHAARMARLSFFTVERALPF
jgi:hypothetical protein